jgi:hypothetical protein
MDPAFILTGILNLKNMKKTANLIIASVIVLLTQSCTKESTSTTAAKSEIKINFKGKSYTITPAESPSLYAASVSLPLANSTGGQQQISRVSFYGESSQIALGTAAFKKGGPEGTYSFEALLGQYSQYWRLGAFYQHSQDLPSLSFTTTVPAPGDITAVVLVDKTAGNIGYIPVPSASSLTITTATDKQISGSFNLQVRNGAVTETVTGTFSVVK